LVGCVQKLDCPAEERSGVLAYIAGFLQALAKGSVVKFAALENKDTDLRQRPLLRPHHHRPRRRAPDPCDELSPPHPDPSQPLHREPIPPEDAWERGTTPGDDTGS
jgi:hypothetical protein